MIDHLLPTDFFHHGIRQEGDLRLICHLFLQYLRATQFLSAVNQIHFFTSGCQIQGIFQCHISTADNRHCLVTEKSSITGCTVRHPGSCQCFFSRHPEFPVSGSGCQQYGFCLIDGSGSTGDFPRSVCIFLYVIHFIADERNLQCFCMLLKFLCQIKPIGFRQSQIIINFLRINHLSATHRLFL